MIKRDASFIICQHDTLNPQYLDGGDSANRTGIYAFVGSKLDQDLVTRFVTLSGECIRHPEQIINRNPNNFSRDQLLPLVAGLKRSRQYHLCAKIFYTHKKRWFFCQNSHFHPSGIRKECPNRTDLLHPGNIWHLILCAKLYRYYWFAPIGYLFQIFDIIFSCFIRPKSEQNQYFIQFAVSGLLPVYLCCHPDFNLSMIRYWGGWRDQIEIAEAIIDYCEHY